MANLVIDGKGIEASFPELRQAISPNLDSLCEQTKFDRSEIKVLYQIFKQHCPQGFLTLDILKIIFESLFPSGSSSKYATYFYRCFDIHNTGSVEFENFLEVLSTINYGTPEQQFSIIFRLYDIKGDGYITRDTLFQVIESIYDLISIHHNPKPTYKFLKQSTERIFKKMDYKKNGIITIDEFLKFVIQDQQVQKSYQSIKIPFTLSVST